MMKKGIVFVALFLYLCQPGGTRAQDTPPAAALAPRQAAGSVPGQYPVPADIDDDVPAAATTATAGALGTGTTMPPATTATPATALATPAARPRSGVLSSGTSPKLREKKKKDKQTLPELSADSVRTLKKQRGLTSFSNIFVPQGQWVAGINASFSTHSNNDYTFVVIEGINSEGHTVKIAPVLAYAVANNMALGARFTYSRTYLRIDSGSIQLGDDDTGIDLKADSDYSLKHVYEGALIWRQYIPLGNNKRFALFNEMQFAIGGSQAKFASGSPVKGTYETGLLLSLGISPGLVAFATNNMAFEVNVGVMGISYSSIKQVHNQVTVGKRSSSMMNFKVNIFSIGLGVAFYL